MTASPFVEALTIQRTFKASRAAVFNVWKDPDLLRQWLGGQFYKKLNASVDFRVGGSYHLDIISPEGEIFHLFGEYQVIDEPERLVFTWAFDNWQVPENITLVTVTFAEEGSNTLLTLVHERFRDVPTRTMHNEGWIARFDLIDKFLT